MTSTTFEQLDDEAIRQLVERLSRRHPSGGAVIERAAIMAEGAKSAAILAWITSHDWEPEEAEAAPTTRAGLGGLHGMRQRDIGRSHAQAPRRYVLRPGAGS
ncbi:MAG TPA: hypothetical protein VK501_01365 [Baekduia sp.]|uniref:hypothetical protein n=1 Tax=Baekduia sp. TaxID=2600305 RepID=UPI002C100D8C|nr:hypothetical protein [Baekduia sp.]HMJ32536.1 hypothetical protein [Baekduia sp.]